MTEPGGPAEGADAAELAYAARLAGLSRADRECLQEAVLRVEAATSFGGWVGSVQREDGSRSMPYATLSPECEDFLRTFGRLGLYIPFDWPDWDRGRELAKAPEQLQDASPAQAAMLICAISRSDRFVEGALLGAFEDGLIQQAARRVLGPVR